MNHSELYSRNLEKMDIFDTNYFLINKKMLSLVGLWPYDDKASKNIKRSFFIAAIGVVTILPQVKNPSKNKTI
uniref:Uncharacterized protein n=1 Tax=Trichogramma kaykai TaxID=54128 RepID=A0ABD2XIG4_9HYME